MEKVFALYPVSSSPCTAAFLNLGFLLVLLCPGWSLFLVLFLSVSSLSITPSIPHVVMFCPMRISRASLSEFFFFPCSIFFFHFFIFHIMIRLRCSSTSPFHYSCLTLSQLLFFFVPIFYHRRVGHDLMINEMSLGVG